MKSSAIRYKGCTYKAAANIRVKQALARVDQEMGKISEQVRLYSGVSAADASEVKRVCQHIIDTAQEIVDEIKDPPSPEGGKS